MSEIEVKKEKTKTIVVFPHLPHSDIKIFPEARLEEARGLALAIDLNVVYSEVANIKAIKSATLFSKGFIERIIPIINEYDVTLLIVDGSLSPIQQRNLEKSLKIKVIDRTALILEIFGERAKTKEGVLQVELAHLSYQRSRLVRSWTHLERQRGGAGFLGGPGETQIELDRRIIDDKIVRIKKELEKVTKTRELQRSARKKVPYPVVALVGYTNAGKSSIFNKLSKAEVFAKDLLFATLDPTMRKIKLPSGREIILSDTVGFISDLPHELVLSFRATLEEVLAADIIVHVRDIANPNTKSQKTDVLKVLDDLGLKHIENDKRYIEVLNKIDLLETKPQKGLSISAVTGEGLDDLLQAIDEKLSQDFTSTTVKVPASNGKLLSWLHQNSEVLSTKLLKETLTLKIKISPENLAKLKSKLP